MTRSALATIVLLYLLGGCGHRPVPYLSEQFTCQLQVIEPVELGEQSQTPPIPVAQLPPDQALAPQTQPTTQPTVPLDLTDVRAAALANNLDLKVERLEPQIARTFIGEEEARFESLFALRAAHAEADLPSSDLDAQRVDRVIPAVSIPLRSGGTIEFSSAMTRLDGSGVAEDNEYLAAPRFSISHQLLRGAGVHVNTAAIRVAQYNTQIANARTRLEAIRILANADRAYWLLYAARRELDVRRQQYDLAATQLAQARRRVAIGASAQIEITRAESGVAARLEDIILAQTLVRRRERDLKRIMQRDDLPMDGDAEVVTATGPNPLLLTLDARALADAAVDGRMEMLELELQITIDSLNVDVARNETLPLVALEYSYAFAGSGRALDRAFDDAFDSDTNEWSIGLTVEVPLGNEAARSRLRRALLTRVQRLATKDLRRAAIRQEVLDAVDQLNQDWQRVLAARQETITAGRTYEAEARLFELGQRNSTDVLLAAERLAEAQSREVRALADYEISQVDIAFATGTLLGRDRVWWSATEGENSLR